MNELSNCDLEQAGPLSLLESEKIRHLWRAANFLSLGEIFLKSSGILHHRLSAEDIKDEIFGEWGTIPGINLVWVHLNRILVKHKKKILFIAGSGHGNAAMLANAYLEGTLSDLYPEMSLDREGMTELFLQYSFEWYSRKSPFIPGVIQDGYTLGFSLARAYGAILDNPDLIACCLIGDGEAETGPLSASWFSHLYLNPVRDGLVLPILHLNRYKVAAPSTVSRLSNEQLLELFSGYGYEPRIVEGSDPELVHQFLASAMDSAFERFDLIKKLRQSDQKIDIRLPLIILKTPKGWTGPKIFEDEKFEDSSVDLKLKRFAPKESNEHLRLLERWFHSYNIKALFDKKGRLLDDLAAWIPERTRQLSRCLQANGGQLIKPLVLPSLSEKSGNLSGLIDELGLYLSQLLSQNKDTFRIFSTDGANSGQYLADVLTVTTRALAVEESDRKSDTRCEGRVMEILSHHTCEGWLEGYVLSGRHALFVLSEQQGNILTGAFSRIAHWIACAKAVSWREPISGINYLLISSSWPKSISQPVNQPGFIAAALSQPDALTNVWLPADATCMLSVMNHCLQSKNCINIMVADVDAKHKRFEYHDAENLCLTGIGYLKLSKDKQDIVLACAGAYATSETMEAADLLSQLAPELNFSVVNVLNLSILKKLGQSEYFPVDTNVVFAYHGFAAEIKGLLGNCLDLNKLEIFDTQTDINRFSIARCALLNSRKTISKRALDKLDELFKSTRSVN